MPWTLAGAEVTDLLASARPGLVCDGHPVPRVVFHDAIHDAAIRLLKAYVAYGQGAEHELDWLVRAALGIRMAATGPYTLDDDEALALYPGGHLGLQATLNVLPVLHGSRPSPMAAIAGWVADAQRWATKRHTGDRRCPHDPASLLARARAIHGDIAEHAGADREPAEAAEAREQRADLEADLPTRAA